MRVSPCLRQAKTKGVLDEPSFEMSCPSSPSNFGGVHDLGSTSWCCPKIPASSAMSKMRLVVAEMGKL